MKIKFGNEAAMNEECELYSWRLTDSIDSERETQKGRTEYHRSGYLQYSESIYFAVRRDKDPRSVDHQAVGRSIMTLLVLVT